MNLALTSLSVLVMLLGLSTASARGDVVVSDVASARGGTQVAAEASSDALPRCEAEATVVAQSDDAAACAAICSVHFPSGSADHRQCVACCYDPNCQ
mgnify:CR=1 FL=1